MKTFSILALCAVLFSTAASAAVPAAKPATPAKAAAASPATPVALHGFWKSVNATGGAMSGSIDLRPDGKASLIPQGEIRLEGTWRVTGQNLILEMPPYGSSQMQYAIKAKRLTLTYENGVKQNFTLSVPKK